MKLSEIIAYFEKRIRRCEEWLGNYGSSEFGGKADAESDHELFCAILSSLRRLQAIEEASEMPEEPQTFLNGPEGDTWVRWTQYDALHLHVQHLASKELKRKDEK